MRFEYSQSLKLGQNLKMAPRMIQSMEILQMSLADLQERIEQELENNPTLELAENEADASTRAEAEASLPTNPAEPLKIGEDDKAEFSRLDEFEEEHPDAADNAIEDPRPRERDLEYRPASGGDAEGDAKMEAMAALPARSAPLVDQLQDQWTLSDADEAFKPLGELLISYIDDDGYLRTPLSTIVERSTEMLLPPLAPGGPMTRGIPTEAHLEHVLAAVQLFLDPPGIAARTPRECLLLQLDALAAESAPGRDDIPGELIEQARRVVAEHLDDLMKNRLPLIAEKTGLTLDQIKQTLMLLKKLSLAPGRRLVTDAPSTIIPDAIVEWDPDGDRYICYLNESRLPNLRVNMEYAMLSKDKSMERKDREFIKTNLGNAQWLIDAVHQRKHTLLRVLQSVVVHQREYFDVGPQALKPLPMTQVAEELGIHVATVSRAVAEKYVQTPRGAVPLRKLFSGGIPTAAESGEPGTESNTPGESMAWDAIKEALREVIDGEDKSKPLSDDALVLELKKRGIDIARRTVAKYRDQLGIPTARMRKTF
jgi:RNA polymerase sigma-54 factor